MTSTETPNAADGHRPLRELLREREQRLRAAQARLRRCRGLGTPTEAELARMVAEFHARGGRVTACAPAHLLPVQNGAGREARRWVA